MNERLRLAPQPVRSARALQRAAVLRANDLVLEALEEELTSAPRAKRLLGVIPHRGLAATGRVRGPELLERRPTGTGRHQDLPESVSTEIAVKLSTNSHVNLHPERPKNDARAVLVPITQEGAFAFR
jgi:hypothetical protein